MQERDPEFDAWVQRARDGSFDRAVQLCGFTPARGMGKGKDQAGPCPDCGGRDRFAVNFAKRKFNCRGCGAKGADALSLALVGGHLSFVDAVEELSGEPRPAKVGAETEEEKAARLARRADADAARVKQAAEKARVEEAYRQKARETCVKLWERANAPSTKRLGVYFASRGLALPGFGLLREVEAMPYWHGEEVDERGYKHPRIIHAGPAMLAAMVDNAGAIVGLHITYLRADWAGKAAIFDPETGEVLNAKKMRGSKKGAHIVVRQMFRPDYADKPARLFMAEGIETVASVAMALKRSNRLSINDVFWAAGDLHNIGGGAKGKIDHPSFKHKNGRAQSLPSAVPDMDAPAIAIPPSVTQLVLLGDGDSEAFLTRTTLERGKARYTAAREALRDLDGSIPPLTIGIAMAEKGMDFNDMLRGAA